MKSYNAVGYAIVAVYASACMVFAPTGSGSLLGLAIGALYFIVFWYLAGVYLADVLHLGIAHRSLNYADWFTKTVTIVNNLFEVYVDSDRQGEPAPPPLQAFGPSGRPEQASQRRILADAVPLPGS